MQAEVWENQWGDLAIFVGKKYVIYDKVDRLGAEVLCMHKDMHEHNIEDIKLDYYKNGFRPVEDESNTKSIYCRLCENFGCCGKDGGCCGDDVLTKPCCTCNKGRVCPGQHGIKDNFKLKTIDIYETKLKEKGGDNNG